MGWYSSISLGLIGFALSLMSERQWSIIFTGFGLAIIIFFAVTTLPTFVR